MRILIPVAATSPSGGYRMLCELALKWRADGHVVDFFAPAHADPPYFPGAIGTRYVTTTGDVADHPTPSPALSGIAVVRATMRALTRGLQVLSPGADVVVANHSVTAWPVALFRTPATKVYYIQAYEAEDYWHLGTASGRVLGSLAYASYWLPLYQIVNSPTYVGYRNLHATEWMPAGVDLDRLQPPAGGQSWDGGPFLMGCIGRPERFKGTVDVVDAYEMLRAQGHNVGLRIAHGHFPAGRVMPEGCEVVPCRNDDELVAFYQSLHVLVAPATIHIGAPHCPAMEAMACGVPVVSTGAIPALPGADNSWIVPPEAPRAIADAVLNIITDAETRERRIAKAARDIREFGWDRLAPRMLDLFRQARSGR